MEESDLIFPSITGGFRSPSVLNKPFAEVAEAIGLGKRFTQRGLRPHVVTRSISGHLTERMQHHYSTVNAEEQRGSIARVIDLMEARDERTTHEAEKSGAPTGAPTPTTGAPNEKAG